MKACKRLIVKLAISGIILYLLTVRFCDITAGVTLGRHPLEIGWQNTGLAFQEVSFESWGRISGAYETREALLNRLNRLKSDLGLRLTGEPIVGGDRNFRYVNAEGQASDGSLVIITLQSIERRGQAETYLGFELNHPGKPSGLGPMIARYERILRRAGIRSPLSVAISGEIPGRLDEAAVENIFSRLFQGLNAIRIGGGFDGNCHAWRGRTPLLPGKIEWNGEAVNLETAAVYDGDKDTTIFTLATPGRTEEL